MKNKTNFFLTLLVISVLLFIIIPFIPNVDKPSLVIFWLGSMLCMVGSTFLAIDSIDKEK